MGLCLYMRETWQIGGDRALSDFNLIFTGWRGGGGIQEF